MNSAVSEAAAAVVDEVLPVQEHLGELLGFPTGQVVALQQLRERRRGGRPPGARNKRLDEIARLVRERFGDVLLQQVAVAAMPLEDLIALGLKPGEALAEKRLSAATVLPYIEQRRPIAVDVTGRQVVHLTINPVEIGSEENQGVVEGFALQLDSVELDDARKPLMPQAAPAPAQLMADQAPPAPPPPPPPPIAPAPEAPHPPRGGDFGPVAPLHAPAAVVPPRARILHRHANQGPAHPGGGGRLPR